MSLMLSEIGEQPEVLEITIKAERAKIEKLGAFLRRKTIDLIVVVARGSSDNASLFGRYLLETTCGIPVSLAAPSVYTLYNAKLKLGRALVIGVSQSGEGADINQVLESAKKSARSLSALPTKKILRWQTLPTKRSLFTRGAKNQSPPPKLTPDRCFIFICSARF